MDREPSTAFPHVSKRLVTDLDHRFPNHLPAASEMLTADPTDVKAAVVRVHGRRDVIEFLRARLTEQDRARTQET